jgi:DNA-binding response OmpR family regulator
MVQLTAYGAASASVAAVRWPYRLVAVESPAGPLTVVGHSALLDHGVDLHLYADGPSALLGLMAEDPGAVVAPTDLVGVDFLRFVRAIVAWSDVPIIIGLTGDQESHRQAFEALDAGARGLLGLPFAPEQLASAIRHIGLGNLGPAASIQYGALELDRQAHQARVSGTVVGLSPREFTLLEYLVAEAPRVVSTAELAAVCSVSEIPAGPMLVRKYVQKLRRKLSLARPGEIPVIETIRGLGYRLTGG